MWEPIDELPEVTDKLAPRLEGKDVQDIDDLVKYARREIDALPATIRGKVIGNVQPPLQYDRSVLQDVRPALEAIENEARVDETERIGSILRNSMLYLAVWEVLLILFGVFLLAGGSSLWPENSSTPLFVLIVLLGLGIIRIVVHALARAGAGNGLYQPDAQTPGALYRNTVQSRRRAGGLRDAVCAAMPSNP